jgi:hypothetical protein
MTAAVRAWDPDVALVVPTVGRPSLRRLLDSLADASGPLPTAVVLVDDRRRATAPLFDGPAPARLRDRLTVLRGPGRGPAAARNVGWRAVATAWVAFVDDDVEVTRDWLEALARDLSVGPEVGASQGRIVVPLPDDRPATDWERNVAGLEHARWATADMAYRRTTLVAVGGFDERFPRAYREDADLGLRVTRRGWRIVTGDRSVRHPIRPVGPWAARQCRRRVDARAARRRLAGGRGRAAGRAPPAPADRPGRAGRGRGARAGPAAGRRGGTGCVGGADPAVRLAAHRTGPPVRPRGRNDAVDQRGDPPGRHVALGAGLARRRPPGRGAARGRRRAVRPRRHAGR